MLEWRDMPRLPPGGHHYKEVDGTVLRGNSRDEVIKAMTEHRASNSLTLGDPESDLKRYYSRIAPYMVRVRGWDETAINGLRQQCAENIHAIWYGRFAMTKGWDEKRNEICARCPCRTNWFDENDPVTVYSEEADIRASMMIAMFDTASDGICRHHKVPLSILNRLAEPQLIASSGAPAECWVNKREETTDAKP